MWVFTEALDIQKKNDWEFQENILIAKNIAITRHIDLAEWVSIMVSKNSFPGNIKIEASVAFTKESEGVGFLLNIPDQPKRIVIEEGYCLWLGSEKNPGCKLFRSNVLVMETPNFSLPEGVHQVKIERTDNLLHFFLDDNLILSYATQLPLTGSHVGLLVKDAHFSLDRLHIFSSSRNLMVHCLAVPDAFLAKKDYDSAIFEYRRISKSFPGRVEGSEALFRSGLSLLEKGKNSEGKTREELFSLAHEEFQKLHATPGAPLEYLGKSLIYAALSDYEEEAKCLELAIRKYPPSPPLAPYTGTPDLSNA